MVRDVALLGSRIVVGGYMVAHGAQKLFGSFGGKGLDAAAEGFERMGLTPGREMATAAGASEVCGGVLTITGSGYPFGPLVIMGTMAVAAETGRPKGAFAAQGGYELPLTNLAAAAALAAAGPGRISCGPRLAKGLTVATAVVGTGLTAWMIREIMIARHAADDTRPAAPEDEGVREPGTAGQVGVAPRTYTELGRHAAA